MGGTAVLIHGTVSAERLAPRPVPRTLLDRVLGRTRQVGPRLRPMGRRELVEVDAADLAPLIARYRDYLARKLPDPHEATRQVLECLELDRIPSLYVRGEREGGAEPSWYVQLGFSGCAGMAEVSAVVAGHWAAAWLEEEMPRVEREILVPFGFMPAETQTFDWPDRFLPVAELGYLRYVPPEEREADGVALEMDHAVVDAVEDAETRLAEISRRHAALIEAGRCHCQLCNPAYMPLR